MIHTILFDLDNTILDFDKAERRAVRCTLETLGITPAPAVIKRYSQLNLEQWKLLELGKLTRQEVKLRRYQLLFQEIGVNASAQEAAKLYETELGVGHYFIDGAEELLETLAKDYSLYLVTNGTASVQKSRLKSAGIGKYFRSIFISEDMGANKPSLKYFEACFRQIPGFRREETVIIGDSLTSDIKGGKNAGIRTIWYNPGHALNETEIIPDREIERLEEVYDLVGTEDF